MYYSFILTFRNDTGIFVKKKKKLKDYVSLQLSNNNYIFQLKEFPLFSCFASVRPYSYICQYLE